MLPVLVLLLAVLGAYVQALGGTFVWDDRLLVLDAPLVERAGSLGEYLQSPFWAGGAGHERETTYYRPLVTLSFALDHAVHGSNAAGYHLTNVVLHATCALLLLALVRRAGVRAPSATLLCAGWALQPRLAECAAWISGRTDLIATLFTLAAALAWGRSWQRRVLAAALLGLGLLAKESALAGLPALALLEWVRAEPGSFRQRAGVVASRTAPLTVIVLLYVALRAAMVGHTGETASLGAGYRLLTVLHTVGTYVQMLVDAWRPRAVIGRLGIVTALSIGIGVLTLAGSAWAARRFGRELAPETALGFGLAVFALAPVLHVVPLPIRTLAADRFLYLPTAGLVLGLAVPLDRWLGTARVRFGAAVAVVLSLGAVAFERVGVWSDEVEFWVTTYLETPHVNSAPPTELFGVFYRAGLYEEALVLIERARRYDDPNKKDPAYNAALCLARLGRREEALQRFREARSKRKSNARIDVLMAILSLQTGRTDEARAVLEPLARRGDRQAQALLLRLPELEQAASILGKLGPDDDPEQRARLATVVGDDPTAIDAWSRAARLPTASRETLHDALAYLVQTGAHDALLAAGRAYVSRYGPLEPKLAAMVDVRLGELERLADVKPRLGLK